MPEAFGNNMTALQKHVSFFDRNHDGIIFPNETLEGLMALGSNITLSTAATALIHTALSQKTRPGKPLSMLFPIEIENIKGGKHGSDSGAYDNEGMFVESKFEEIFTKYAVTHKDALTEGELGAMLEGNKVPNDVAGSVAASTEWKMLYNLFKDKDGLLQKQTVKDSFDGTLFYQMEKKNNNNAK
ncbi:probable peroxygenase 5 [Impatiens glandulifera]|uniref:probable peroxygenase 5 n=1 Tax=Impatiens glandulifera TaxID=253017 RepID=UPI001FB15A2C|nr:probable peroxygenase 5 [Impatiens glandulifera]